MRWFIHRLPKCRVCFHRNTQETGNVGCLWKGELWNWRYKGRRKTFDSRLLCAFRILCHVNMSTVWLKGKIRLLYEPAVPLIGINTREINAYVLRKTWTRVFVVAFLIIGKTWKHSNCPSIGKWIYTLNYIYWMEYHIAIKKNKPWCILSGIECWATGFNTEG